MVMILTVMVLCSLVWGVVSVFKEGFENIGEDLLLGVGLISVSVLGVITIIMVGYAYLYLIGGTL